MFKIFFIFLKLYDIELTELTNIFIKHSIYLINY